MNDAPASPVPPDSTLPGPLPGDRTGRASTKPRRWRIGRWLLAVALVVCAYLGWRQYDFRSAMAEAKALGWSLEYDDPIDAIRQDWKAAFKVATWRDGRRIVTIDVWREKEEDRRLLCRLDPRL